jgi:hypothetical protein
LHVEERKKGKGRILTTKALAEKFISTRPVRRLVSKKTPDKGKNAIVLTFGWQYYLSGIAGTWLVSEREKIVFLTKGTPGTTVERKIEALIAAMPRDVGTLH